MGGLALRCKRLVSSGTKQQPMERAVWPASFEWGMKRWPSAMRSFCQLAASCEISRHSAAIRSGDFLFVSPPILGTLLQQPAKPRLQCDSEVPCELPCRERLRLVSTISATPTLAPVADVLLHQHRTGRTRSRLEPRFLKPQLPSIASERNWRAFSRQIGRPV